MMGSKHSSLTRIRERSGVEVFRRFFEQIVKQCQAAGLVWGRELYIDGTKVQANASRDSLKPRFFVEAHHNNLFAEHAAGATEAGEQDTYGGYLGDLFHTNALMMTTTPVFSSFPHYGQGFPDSSFSASFGTDILSSHYRTRIP